MPDPMLVAIDPGKLTGLAMFYLGDVVPVLSWSDELDFDLFQDTFADYASRQGILDIRVVIEEFKITAATGKLSDAPWSLEHIGVVRYFCRKYDIPLAFQPPAKAKNFVPNDRLKALNMWHVGGAGHANDAIRHGVLYLVENTHWHPSGLLD